MKVKNILLILIIPLIIILIIIFLYLTFSFTDVKKSDLISYECGFSAGPYYGDKIEINYNNLKIDHFISIPNGKIIFSNINNDNPIIIAKASNKNNITWAYKFLSEKNTELPFTKITILEYIENKDKKIIHIFNDSYSEPGKIYLDKNYNFKYLCLKPL